MPTSYWGARKPTAGTPLNWGHSLTSGLVMLLPFNEGAGVPQSVTSIPNKVSATTPGDTLTWSPRRMTTVNGVVRDARGVALTDVDYKLVLGSSSVIPTKNCTIAVGLRKRDTTNRQSCAFAVNDGTDGNKCHVHLPYSDGTVYFDFGGGSEGSTRLSVGSLSFATENFWVFATGARGMEIWQDAKLRASNTANPTRAQTVNEFVLGEPGNLIAVQADLVDYSFFAVWRRQLSKQEIVSLTAEPFQMFQPPVVMSIPGSFTAGQAGGGGGGASEGALALLGVGT